MMVSVTVLIHFVELSVLLALISRYRPSTSQAGNIVGNAIAILSAAFGLFALQGLKIWAYGLLYGGCRRLNRSRRRRISRPQPMRRLAMAT
ncbi:MAG: hypothetical protein LH610_05385 [Sphingomonas bacterium]|nr:hypothetical protein [Sphingomonas bacterium]